MGDGIDEPVRRVGDARAWGALDPAECIELIKHCFHLVAFQVPHGAVAARNISVGDALELVGEDVAGHCGKAVMVVGQAEYPGIEGDGVRQEEAVQEAGGAAGGVFGDGGGQLRVIVFEAMPDHAKSGEYTVVLADMGGQPAVDDE